MKVVLSKYEFNPSINEKVMTSKAKLKKYDVVGQGHIKAQIKLLNK